MRTIGIVVQRCHHRVVGGAESLAWQWANLLKNEYQVDILTTTALDAATWDNALPPVNETREGITVRRFRVDQGRTPYWHELHRLLLVEFADLSPAKLRSNIQKGSLSWPLALQEEFIFKQGPYSEGLIHFLSENFQNYPVIIFFTYLFPTTYFGIQKVPRERCLFVPTLHNEAPAYLSAYRHMARRARMLLWNTEAEERLGSMLWGELPGRTVGSGINTREFPPSQPGYPYLLYCGRIDPFKGLPQLLDYFMRYKKEHPSDLRLVLTGKDELGLPKDSEIEFRGFVSEEEKFQLMAGALVFVMPSPHESLSMVTLEAMGQVVPALVNGKSEVLADHIKKSGGGSIYIDYGEFSTFLNNLLKNPSMGRSMGEKARDYVVAHYSLESVKNRLVEIIESRDDLKELRRNWHELGRLDPLGNILTDPIKKGRWTQEEFFKNGEEEIASVMDYIESLNMNLPRNRALDFGCGVGRLTQALCHYFEECSGVDIAPSMIELANKYNEHANRCQYHLNESDDLKLFEDNRFDFIYSNIVLQHIKPEFSKKYIVEFLRILAPGGLIIFQIPSEQIPDAKENSIKKDNRKISRELPTSAFKARITLMDPPVTLKTFSQVNLLVKIKNMSDVTWPSSEGVEGKYKINLGNHWLNEKEKMIMIDDGRVSLSKDLGSMDEVDLLLPITAPPEPGTYFLELDMVQEGVVWFKEKGSNTVKVRVSIETGIPPGKLSPRMEMHGVKKTEIIELIESNGGRIVDIQEFNVSGEEWLSFKYCVTK